MRTRLELDYSIAVLVIGRGHGGHDDGVTRPQDTVLTTLGPRDPVCDDPRSVLKTEIFVLTREARAEAFL